MHLYWLFPVCHYLFKVNYVKRNNPFSKQTTVIFESMEKHTPFTCHLSKYLYYFVRANCKKYTWNFTNNWECCQNNIQMCISLLTSTWIINWMEMFTCRQKEEHFVTSELFLRDFVPLVNMGNPTNGSFHRSHLMDTHPEFSWKLRAWIAFKCWKNP